MKKMLIDLNVFTTAILDKKRESIEFLDKAKDYEVYEPLNFFTLLSRWKDRNSSDSIMKKIIEVKKDFINEFENNIKAYEKTKKDLNELAIIVVNSTKIKYEDALFVINASLFGIDLIVTYNKKDLLDKRKEINNLLKELKLKEVKLSSPEELLSRGSDDSSNFFSPFSLKFLTDLKSSFLSHNINSTLGLFKDFNSRKGFTLVAFVITVALTVAGISLTLTFLLPEIDRAKASGIINNALQQMNVIDNIVREVAGEGRGSQRTFQLKVDDGLYQVKNDTGSFEFDYTAKYSPLDQGISVKRNNVLLSTTVTGAKAYESDEDNDGFSELVIENEALKATFRKYPFDYITWGIRDVG